jgi:hypothetical protein
MILIKTNRQNKKHLTAGKTKIEENAGVTRPYSWYFNGRDNYPCILMRQQGYQSH